MSAPIPQIETKAIYSMFDVASLSETSVPVVFPKKSAHVLANNTYGADFNFFKVPKIESGVYDCSFGIWNVGKDVYSKSSVRLGHYIKCLQELSYKIGINNATYIGYLVAKAARGFNGGTQEQKELSIARQYIINLISTMDIGPETKECAIAFVPMIIAEFEDSKNVVAISDLMNECLRKSKCPSTPLKSKTKDDYLDAAADCYNALVDEYEKREAKAKENRNAEVACAIHLKHHNVEGTDSNLYDIDGKWCIENHLHGLTNLKEVFIGSRDVLTHAGAHAFMEIGGELEEIDDATLHRKIGNVLSSSAIKQLTTGALHGLGFAGINFGLLEGLNRHALNLYTQPLNVTILTDRKKRSKAAKEILIIIY